MRDVLFIGSNPSQASTFLHPFHCKTRSGKILSSWWDKLSYEKSSFIAINVANMVTHRNRPLSIKEIKEALPRLKQSIGTPRYVKLVALGKTAEKALTLLRLDYYAMPHPSGLNRKLNNKEYVAEKIKGLQDYLNKP